MIRVEFIQWHSYINLLRYPQLVALNCGQLLDHWHIVIKKSLACVEDSEDRDDIHQVCLG